MAVDLEDKALRCEGCRLRPGTGVNGGRVSSLSAENTLRLTALSHNETEVSDASEAAVVGRLGKVSLGVMKKKAESLGRCDGVQTRNRATPNAISKVLTGCGFIGYRRLR
jgi:hypothetical protein